MKIKFFVAAACVALLIPLMAAETTPARAESVKAVASKSEPVKVETKAEVAPVSEVDDESGKAKKKARRAPKSQRESVAPAVSALESECSWIGKRISSLLNRDDIDAARQFEMFYSAFGCPIEHLGKAFGCVVASESVSEPVEARIDRCWAHPSVTPTPLASDAAVEKPAGDTAAVKAPEATPRKARSGKPRKASQVQEPAQEPAQEPESTKPSSSTEKKQP